MNTTDKKIKIALCQINPTVGALVRNFQKILQFYRKAEEEKCDLAIFPECALAGYPAEDLIFRASFIKKNLNLIRDMAKEVKGPCQAIVGYIGSRGGKATNSAALLGNGKMLANYSKHALPNYGVFDEKRYFIPGTESGLIKVRGIPIGLSICEDIWDEKEFKLTQKQVKSGAKLLINISASPYDSGKFERRINLIKQRVRQTNRALIYVNLVGGQDELVFDGRSMVMDPKGNCSLLAQLFKEDIQFIEFEFTKSALKTARSHRDPGTFSKPKQTNAQEIYEALVLGTRDYVEKNNFKSVLIGLSGGIDSALTAAIAVDALGKDKVLAVTMPSRFSSPQTIQDAELVAHNLGVKLLKIPIETIFKSYLDSLSLFGIGLKTELTEENLQSRIRGTLLMALSNKLGALVLTTGNKSEVSVGYCTLYGDTAGGFAVLKDVPKTMVYRLSNYVNERSVTAPIPHSTIERPPTAELKENQKDQDTLPPYDILDQIIQRYVEEDKGHQDLVKNGFNPELVSKVIRMIDANEYKRRQSPPGIKISYKSFGKDRRIPITNEFKEF